MMVSKVTLRGIEEFLFRVSSKSRPALAVGDPTALFCGGAHLSLTYALRPHLSRPTEGVVMFMYQPPVHRGGTIPRWRCQYVSRTLPAAGGPARGPAFSSVDGFRSSSMASSWRARCAASKSRC